jgi:GntR family transcriptional regulator/MocR family aminotransferase
MTDRFNYPIWNMFQFDRQSGQPLHDQLFLQLSAAIAAGQIGRGTRLPPSRKMASELGISRTTVVHSYERLAAEGYLHQKVGVGTFVGFSLPEDFGLKSPDAGPPSAPRVALSRRGALAAQNGSVPMRFDKYDLSPGVPATDQFPYDTFAAISSRYWKSQRNGDLGYGDAGGLIALREQIAQYLGEARGVNCDARQVIIVGSSVQGLTMAAHLLLDAGDVVVVEDPGFVTEVNTLVANDLRPISVPIDGGGLDLDAAGAEVRQARMAVVTPVGQFPFGSVMGMERRQALLAWATRNEAWIFEDDFNSEIRWAGHPLPPLAALARHGKVIYAGSFNRILSPGFRLAYLVVPPDLVEPFAIAQQMLSFHVPLPIQRMVAEFMKGGYLATHLRRMRPIYEERAEVLTRCLLDEFGDAFEVRAVATGLYLTAVARRAIDDVAISKLALRRGLDVPALSTYCRSERILRGFVFGFGNTPPTRIPRCVETFARAVRDIEGDFDG